MQAMATALLGDEIDIHCGGVDNIFPHTKQRLRKAKAAPEKNSFAIGCIAHICWSTIKKCQNRS